MGTAGYAMALVRALVLFGGAAAIGWRLAGWTSRESGRAERLLASIVLGVAVSLTVAQIAGALGLLSFWPMAVTIGALVLTARSLPQRATPVSAAPARLGPLGLLALAVVAGVWAPGLAESYRYGIQDIDSVRYHLPLSAEFAQHGSLRELHYLELDHIATTAPSNTELLGAIGIVAAGNDILAPLFSLLWAGLTLLGGWCLGRRIGHQEAGVAAAAVACVVPISALTAPGSAKNDLAVVALVVAAIALRPPSTSVLGRALVPSAAAAGLALSTKLTAVAPVVAIVVVAAAGWPPGSRRRLVVPGTVLVTTGSFWYVRNVALTGSPLPASDLGPIRAPSPDPVLERFGATILERLDQQVFWAEIPRALTAALGPAWPVLLGACALALAGAVLRDRDGEGRVVAFVAVVAALAYVATPYSAGGPPEDPWMIRINLRFVFVAVVLALMLTPRALLVGRRRLAAVLLGVCLLAPLAAPDPLWNSRPRTAPALAVLAAAAAMGAMWVLQRLRWAAQRHLVLGALVVTAVAGMTVQQRYLDERYRDRTPSGVAGLGDWIRATTDARIGITGVTMSYPLYGTELTNSVDYLGTGGGRRPYASLQTCRALLQAVADQDLDIVVTGSFKSQLETAPEGLWVASDPAFRRAVVAGDTQVFEVVGEPSPDSCRGVTEALQPIPSR